MTGTPRIIKKYPNRRLYDTGISSYVTLEDVRQLVIDGESFQVCDARSGRDLTHGTLLQIITEHEQREQPLLSLPMLRGLIGLQGDPLQHFIGLYLEHSLNVFLEQQTDVHEQLGDSTKQVPAAALEALFERNRTTWNASPNEVADPDKDDKPSR